MNVSSKPASLAGLDLCPRIEPIKALRFPQAYRRWTNPVDLLLGTVAFGALAVDYLAAHGLVAVSAALWLRSVL